MRDQSSSLDFMQLRSETRTDPDPISQYNYVINHYNDYINIKDNIILNKAYSDRLYKFWYIKLRHWYILLFFFYISPYMTFITLIFSLYTMIVHENALAVYRKNSKKNGDVLQNIVIQNSLCQRANSHNIYFNVTTQNLDNFPLPSNTINVLKERTHQGKVQFMVCDLEFVKWSEGLKKPRWLILLHLLLNLALFLIMQIFVYDPYLCFNLFNPINSIKQCSNDAFQNK